MGTKSTLGGLNTTEDNGRIIVGGDEADLPAADDREPAVHGDAKVDDGGVRTNSATAPVATEVGVGAGQAHPAPDNVNRDGREVFEDGVAPTALTTYDPEAEVPEDGVNPVPDDTTGMTADELADAHTHAELVTAATARSISDTTGSKADIAQRIIDHDEAPPPGP